MQVAGAPDTAHTRVDRKDRIVGGQPVDQRRHILRREVARAARFRCHGGHVVAQLAVDFQLAVEERPFGTLPEHREQGLQGVLYIAGQPQFDAGPAADALGTDVHLRDAALLRQEGVVGEIGAQQDQQVRFVHAGIGRRKPQQARHADLEGIVVLNLHLGFEAVSHGGFQQACQLHHLVVGLAGPDAAEERNAFGRTDHVGQLAEFAVLRPEKAVRRQRPRSSGALGAGTGGHVARKPDHGDFAFVEGMLQSGGKHPRKLHGRDGQLVITAAIVEKADRAGLLKIARAELVRWAGRSDGQHRAVAPVGVVKPVYQMYVSRAAAARTAGKSVEFGFGSGRKGPALLVAHVDPPDGSGPAHGVVDFVQAVARNRIDVADTRTADRLDQLVGYFLSHNIWIFNCLHHSRKRPRSIPKLSKKSSVRNPFGRCGRKSKHKECS